MAELKLFSSFSFLVIYLLGQACAVFVSPSGLIYRQHRGAFLDISLKQVMLMAFNRLSLKPHGKDTGSPEGMQFHKSPSSKISASRASLQESFKSEHCLNR